MHNLSIKIILFITLIPGQLFAQTALNGEKSEINKLPPDLTRIEWKFQNQKIAHEWLPLAPEVYGEFCGITVAGEISLPMPFFDKLRWEMKSATKYMEQILFVSHSKDKSLYYVVSRVDYRYKEKKYDFPNSKEQFKYIRIYNKQKGKWWCVFFHITAVKQKPLTEAEKKFLKSMQVPSTP